jgi:hypothetical protein
VRSLGWAAAFVVLILLLLPSLAIARPPSPSPELRSVPLPAPTIAKATHGAVPPLVGASPHGFVGPIDGAYYNESNSSFGGTMQDPLLALNATSGTLYAVDQYHGFLTAVDASNGALLGSEVFSPNPPIGAQVTGFSFLPVSNLLVVSYDWGSAGSLLVFDASTLAPVANLTPFAGLQDYPPGKSLYVASTDQLWLQDLDHGALEVFSASDLSEVTTVLNSSSCPSGCASLGLVDVSVHGYILSETGYDSASEVSVSSDSVLRTLYGPNASFSFGLAAFDAAANELWVQNFSTVPIGNLGLLNASTGAWIGFAGLQTVNFRSIAYDPRASAILLGERDPARCSTNELLWLNGTNGSLLTFGCAPGFPQGAPTSFTQLLPWDSSTASSIIAAGPAEGELFGLAQTPSPVVLLERSYGEIAPITGEFPVPAANAILTAGLGANGTTLSLANASTGASLWSDELPSSGPVAIDSALGFAYVANGTGAVESYRLSDGSAGGSLAPPPGISPTGIAVDPVHGWFYLLSTSPNGTLIVLYNLTAAGGGSAFANVTLPRVAACAWAADGPRALLAVTSCHLPTTPTGNNVTLVEGAPLAKLESISTGVYPSAVAADAAGNLYVAATSSGTVTVVNSTTFASVQVVTPGFFATSLSVDTGRALLLGAVGTNISIRNLSSPTLAPVAVIPGPAALVGALTLGAPSPIVAFTLYTGQRIALQEAEAPSIVSGLSLVPANNSLGVRWSAASNPRPADVVSYSVAVSSSNSGPWSTANNTAGITAEVTGLADGARYYVRVTASNSAGEGPPSAPVNSTPVGTPFPPAFLSATANSSDIELTWGAPTHLDGAPLTGYLLEWATHSPGPWSSLQLGDVVSFDVGNATRGSVYYFRLAAINAVGVGDFAASPAVPFDRSSTGTSWLSSPLALAGILLGGIVLAILIVILVARSRGVGRGSAPELGSTDVDDSPEELKALPAGEEGASEEPDDP